MQARTDGFLTNVSLVSHGSRLQFVVAIALISIIPLLTLVYLFNGVTTAVELPVTAAWTIAVILIGLVSLGYSLLVKYPRAIMKLRHHMENIARGELPETILLPDAESDMTAIAKYFNLIISGMKKRIATIQEQRRELIEAERERVMVESLCTACHHLGQPATVIVTYLELMKRESLSVAGQASLSGCIEAANRMYDVIKQLQSVTEYRPAPYCGISGGEQDPTLNIIEVNSSRHRDLPRGAAKNTRCRDAFNEALISLDRGYRVGGMVELTDRAVCMVKRNGDYHGQPVVEVLIDQGGDHPGQPTMIDLSAIDTLAIRCQYAN